MQFKHLAAALAFSFSLVTAHAAPDVSIPYKPSPTLSALLETADIWGEVYPVAPGGVDTALTRAQQGQAPADQVAAVVIQSTLHFSIGKANQQLPELSSGVEREGKAIEYDEQCGIHPQKGDQFIASYGKAGNPVSAELELKVVKYLSFSDDSDEPLDLAKPEACAQETHSRMFLSGVLRVKQNGKLQQTLPVLMQTIVEPRS